MAKTGYGSHTDIMILPLQHIGVFVLFAVVGKLSPPTRSSVRPIVSLVRCDGLITLWFIPRDDKRNAAIVFPNGLDSKVGNWRRCCKEQ